MRRKRCNKQSTITTTRVKRKDKEIQGLKEKLNSSLEDELINSVIEIKGLKAVIAMVKDVEGEALRNLGDKLRDKLQTGVVILGTSSKDKVQFVAMATKDAVSKGVSLWENN